MLQNIAYCPLLHARIAEMKALFQLPSPSKDRIFPIIVSRPWPNANELSRTWEKITEAFGVRRFGLDLDRAKRTSSSKKDAASQFAELFNPLDGFAAYYELVQSIPSAIPVLRIQGGLPGELGRQAEHIEAIDRGVVVRIEHGAVVDALALVDQAMDRFNDAVFFVDTSWSKNILGREAWASQIIERITDRQPEAELVVTGSSFPDSFTDIGARGIIPVDERSLFANLVRRHNAAALVYGDWGSTRPPSDPAPMRNIPRLDLPTPSEWISFRQNGASAEKEDYSAIAKRMILDPQWPKDLSIWGTYIIGSTAHDEPGAIKSPALAAAARINIHLHRQAYYDAPGNVSDEEEPFEDI